MQMRIVARVGMAVGLATLLIGGDAYPRETKTGVQAERRQCPDVLRLLVVRAPRAERIALFQNLNRPRLLTDTQAAQILGQPTAPEGAFVRRFVAMTIKAQERRRTNDEKVTVNDEPPLWLPSDEEALIALKNLSASGQASELHPYLVKATGSSMPQADADFEVRDCGEDLLIDSIGTLGAERVEIPLVVFLPHPPKRIDVIGDRAR